MTTLRQPLLPDRLDCTTSRIASGKAEFEAVRSMPPCSQRENTYRYSTDGSQSPICGQM